MIRGVGVDVCAIERFANPRPGVLERVFNEAERSGSAATLAGRFAAKEAVAKALGAPAGLVWRDCTVTRLPSGQPVLELSGSVAARAAELGVTKTHLSISHDGGVAVAIVVCEA